MDKKIRVCDKNSTPFSKIMDFLYIRNPSLETFLPTLCADGEVSFDRV